MVVQLSTEALLMGCTMVGAIILWCMRLQSQINSKLARKEHADICDKKHEEIKGFFTEIKREMRDDRKSAHEHREGVNDALGAIRTDVAVMKSHSPEGLFDDAGRLRSGRG